MYDPKGNGRLRSLTEVTHAEFRPPPRLRALVHRFVALRTEAPLTEPYRFHALPDACTYIVFDQSDPRIAGATRLRATAEELDLGLQFDFLNVRLLPGVWQSLRAPMSYGLIDKPYAGTLPLVALNRRLIAAGDADTRIQLLITLIDDLSAAGILRPNPVTERIFARMLDIGSVADMAAAAGLSPRQLQRVLKRSTGFAPHDFLKILRLQQSLAGEPALSFADQSHFIHAFRAATGYTPARFARKYDV